MKPLSRSEWLLILATSALCGGAVFWYGWWMLQPRLLPPPFPHAPWLEAPGIPIDTHTTDASPPVLLPPPDLFHP